MSERQNGTLRMLVMAVGGREGGTLDTALVLGFDGVPDGASFAIGDDVACGDGEFGDMDSDCAEFHDASAVTTGLWVVAWDWQMKHDGGWEQDFVAYSRERWARPTPADFVALRLLPAVPQEKNNG